MIDDLTIPSFLVIPKAERAAEWGDRGATVKGDKWGDSGPARRSVEAKALEQPIYRPRTVKPKRGKGAKYNRAATRKSDS